MCIRDSLGFEHVDVDQPLVAHQPGAFRRDLLAQRQVAGPRRLGRAGGRRPGVGVGRRHVALELLDVVDLQLFQQRRVGVRQPHPGRLAVVAVRMHLHRRRVPDVPAAHRDVAAGHRGHALPADTDLQHVGVLAQVVGAFAGVDDVDGDVRAGGQAQAGRGRLRMRDERGAAAVVGARRVDQAGDLQVDLLLGDHDRWPFVLLAGCGPADVDEHVCLLWPAAVSRRRHDDLRG